jgi:ComF family protein
MTALKQIKNSLLHLLFPHVCIGCGSDVLETASELCVRCIETLPKTNFEMHTDNPVEKLFWGRLPLMAATAQYYFTKESLMQHLMHQFKYKGNRELGLQLGRLMGERLMQSDRFKADALVPLPLFPAKEKKRGYNQSAVLCQGIAEVMNIPVLHKAVTRPHHTETQTKKGRMERWANIEGKFSIANKPVIENKHILLVDDVVTTGATLDSCATELLQAQHVQVSIACLCVASR